MSLTFHMAWTAVCYELAEAARLCGRLLAVQRLRPSALGACSLPWMPSATDTRYSRESRNL